MRDLWLLAAWISDRTWREGERVGVQLFGLSGGQEGAHLAFLRANSMRSSSLGASKALYVSHKRRYQTRTVGMRCEVSHVVAFVSASRGDRYCDQKVLRVSNMPV